MTTKRTIKKCDLCGIETEPGHDWPQQSFKSKAYDDTGFARHDTEIEAVIGDVFPEGDFRTRFRIDVCPKCFVERFIPEVEKLFGITFAKTHADEY